MQAVGLERGSTKTIPFLTSRFEIFLNAKDAVWPHLTTDTGIRLRWIDFIGIWLNSPNWKSKK